MENPYKLLQAILFLHVSTTDTTHLMEHITAAPPLKSTAPTGCPSCWPEVAPADPVTRPFQWDMLDVFKHGQMNPASSRNLGTLVWKGYRMLEQRNSTSKFQTKGKAHRLGVVLAFTPIGSFQKNPALPASSADIWNLNLEDDDTARI